MDARLGAIEQLIRSSVHVDIGSNDARLLVSLLHSKRIERGIAIENKQRPFENSQNALANLNADVRFGDGLSVLKSFEAQSLSISGMGAEKMVGILDAAPDRIPNDIVLQPNGRPELVRRWALRSRFKIVDEQIVYNDRIYTIMAFRACSDCKNDPAYAGVEREAALLFGPLLLGRHDVNLARQLREEENYWSKLSCLAPEKRKRLSIIKKLRKG